MYSPTPPRNVNSSPQKFEISTWLNVDCHSPPPAPPPVPCPASVKPRWADAPSLGGGSCASVPLRLNRLRYTNCTGPSSSPTQSRSEGAQTSDADSGDAPSKLMCDRITSGLAANRNCPAGSQHSSPRWALASQQRCKAAALSVPTPPLAWF